MHLIDQINMLREVFLTWLYKDLKVLPNLGLYSSGKEEHLGQQKVKKSMQKPFLLVEVINQTT